MMSLGEDSILTDARTTGICWCLQGGTSQLAGRSMELCNYDLEIFALEEAAVALNTSTMESFVCAPKALLNKKK